MSGLGTLRFDVIADLLAGGYPADMRPRGADQLADHFSDVQPAASSDIAMGTSAPPGDDEAAAPILANAGLSVILLCAFVSLLLLVLLVVLVRACLQRSRVALEERRHLLPRDSHQRTASSTTHAG